MTDLTAEDFLSLLRASNPIWHETDSFEPPRWIFRGQSDASWSLKPLAWRELEHNPLKLLIERLEELPCVDNDSQRPTKEHRAHAWLHAERFALNEFRKLAWELGYDVLEPLHDHTLNSAYGITGFRDALRFFEDEGGASFYTKDLGLAQHFGLPTRMLDWSFNPLFAIHFAIGTLDFTKIDELSERTNLAVWAFNSSAGFSELIMRIPPRINNPFITAQQGVFLDMEPRFSFDYFVENGEWPSIEKYIEIAHKESAINEDGSCIYSHTHPVLRKFVLPNKEIYYLSQMLEMEGITREKLMPTLENVSKSALMRLQRLALFDTE